MRSGPPTPEQIAAWADYQNARAAFGLLTSDEYALVVGGIPRDDGFTERKTDGS